MAKFSPKSQGVPTQISPLYFWLILIFALSTPLLIITPNGMFPYLGLSLTLTFLTCLVFFTKSATDRHQTTTRFLFFTSLITSVSLVIRADPMITAINILATCIYGSALIFSSQLPFTSITTYLILPLNTVFKGIRNKIRPYRITAVALKAPQQHTTSIIITILILVILIPILSSANPIFKGYIDNTILKLNFTDVLQHLQNNLLLYGLRILVLVGLLFGIPNLLYGHNISSKSRGAKLATLATNSSRLGLLIPKIATTCITLLFIISQFQLYTADSQTLQNLGYTNSQATREIFTQMSIVCIIIFGLLYHEPIRKDIKLQSLSSHTLIIIAYILIIFGLKSDVDYVANFGLTHKRFYGFVSITWITILFTTALWDYNKAQTFHKIPHKMFLITAAIILLINVLNPDRLIHNNPPRLTATDIDYPYLSSMSTDAGHYHTLFDQTSKLQQRLPLAEQAYLRLLYKIVDLQNKYHTLDIPTFNISEYQQYHQIKHLQGQHLLDEYYASQTDYYTSPPTTN